MLTGAWADAQCVLNFLSGVNCTVRVVNLPSGLIAAHLHAGSPEVNGPVVCDARVTPNLSNDFTFMFGCTLSSVALQPNIGIRSFDDWLETFAGSQMYLNVHSAANPSGEVRGQVRFTPGASANSSQSRSLLER